MKQQAYNLVTYKEHFQMQSTASQIFTLLLVLMSTNVYHN